jgi:2-amino-4-hydroxy-6-hydroxymethyldihydropteridine diphosphokinase
MAAVFIGIGSNIENRKKNIEESQRFISESVGTIIERSSIYETEPVGFISETPFLNMVLQIETDFGPVQLLHALLNIEKEMGRVRSGDGYQSRVIDLDILFYNNLVIETKDLVIPHPLLHMRMFVLEPICEIAGDYIHPVLRRSLDELKDDLKG